jgi:hypothetical protein
MMENARNSLEDMVRRFREFAEEAAASPVVTEEHRKFLEQDIELLCGSERDENPGSVKNLMYVLDHYEKLVMWISDVSQLAIAIQPAIQANDQTVSKRERQLRKLAVDLTEHCGKLCGQFYPYGVTDLQNILSAAFGIGIFAHNPIQKRQEMRRVQAKRHPGSDERKATIAKMHKQGSTRCKIAQAVGISEATVDWHLSGMFKAGELQKRSRRGRPKNKQS